MKLNTSSKSSKRGIAMTEYLIILAVVAIACITAAGQFGGQIKQVFTAAGKSLQGKSATVTAVTIDTTSCGLGDAFKQK